MIYFDNNATTQPCEAAKEIFLKAHFANPHSTHKAGLLADLDIAKAKQMISEDIGCDIDEIFFVSSPTEACNWAIQILREKKCEIKYHKYEHSAVLKPILAFPKEKNPKRIGFIQMLVNNIHGEIYEIPKREKETDLIFCDGTAAIGHMQFNFKESGIDLLAFGAHKFNGIRGAACLIIKKDLLPVRSLIWGGDITGGTPSNALILAMAYALRDNLEHLEENQKHLKEMQKYLYNELTQIPMSHLNGPNLGNKRAANNINISFSYMNGSQLQNYLSERNICVSTGSACSSDSFVEHRGGICVRPLLVGNKREPELVTIFKASGIEEGYAEDSIRITLDKYNTMEECKIVTKEIKDIIAFYRPFDF